MIDEPTQLVTASRTLLGMAASTPPYWLHDDRWPGQRWHLRTDAAARAVVLAACGAPFHWGNVVEVRSLSWPPDPASQCPQCYAALGRLDHGAPARSN